MVGSTAVRGVRITADGIRVVPTEPETTDTVRVTVTSSGICGSDLKLASFGPSPVTLGHEFCGQLDDGSAVAVLPVARCGTCDRCLAGEEQQCVASLGSMYGVSRDGGLADEAWVDPACARPLPPGVRLEEGHLVEPLAVALHGLHRAGVVAGMRVLVIGAGPIGLCTIAGAVHLGAEVDLIAHRERRVEAGARLGARIGAGAGYDVVLDAAGTQSSLDAATESVRPGGTVSILGTYWTPVTIGLSIQMKEITLLPAFTYGHHHGVDEFGEAARVLGETPDLHGAMVTHDFSLDDAIEAFRVADDRTQDAIKVVVHP